MTDKNNEDRVEQKQRVDDMKEEPGIGERANENTQECEHPATEALFATRAREWGQEFARHWAAIEECPDISMADDIRIANSKKNLMMETLREMSAKLDIAGYYVNEKMAGIVREDEMGELRRLRGEVETLKMMIDPILRPLSPETGPGPSDHPEHHPSVVRETTISSGPETATQPRMTALDYLNETHALISKMEEYLGPILLGDMPSDQAPPQREMAETTGVAYQIYARLIHLMERLDI